METKQSARKTRLKSSSSDTQSQANEEEMAPNQNGNKTETNDTSMDAVVDEPSDAVANSNKRKLSESSPTENAEIIVKNEEDKNVEELTPVKEIKTEDAANGTTPEIKDDKLLLGKGKRARVPNKRYSDILTTRMRTDTPKATKPPENGEILRQEEVDPLSLTAPPAKKPRTFNRPDLNDPRFLKPFKFGWRREFVLRAEYDVNQKRSGDIYYYTPSGKKIRSIRELLECLAKSKDLTKDDFTFMKEPLGLNDPEKEIIREAKINKKKNTNVKKSPPKTKPKPKSGVLVKTSESPKVGSESKAKSSPRVSTFKVKVPKSNSSKKDKSKINDDDKEGDWSTPQSKKSKSNSYNSEENKPCRPCSIQCDGVLGLIPTLQCRICLCLYHNECVGLPTQTVIQGYICKNCQLEQEPPSANQALNNSPPTLTPINQLKSTPPGTIPTLQRIPSLTDSTSQHSNTESKPNTEQQKSILGSVTTWFPPSSTIQVGNNENSAGEPQPYEPPRPQLVEFIGNKKYLVIPRHNVLSVATTNINQNSDENDKSECDINSDAVNALNQDDKTCESNSIEIKSVVVPLDKYSNHEDLSKLEAAAIPQTDLEKAEPIPKAKAKSDEEDKVVASKFMETYLQTIAYGYKTLLCVFQYLKVQDLLRAGCVCTMWRDVSRHPSLWSTVRMKNSQIYSFDGLAAALQERGTTHLDLRKMLLPANGNYEIWPEFTSAIKKVEGLRKIELCRCLASVVEDLARNNPHLEAINAVTIKCDSMTFDPFQNLQNLIDLRIKSTAGLTLTSDLSSLQQLTKLKHLSITSIKDLNKQNIEVIGELVNLEVLDLGECTDFPKHFGSEILSKLVKLEKLRLEKGQGECHTFEILGAVKDLKSLQQLELVNFDMTAGFDNALGACENIKKLLMIPTYTTQSATTNHMVLSGVLKLQKTLSHFVWGVTLELLRVTELFVDQCEHPDKKDVTDKMSGDCIPVLRPVPLQGIAQRSPPTPPNDTPQVEILPLPMLQKLLLQNLPTTRVKILKIPFHATWRQNITESTS